MPGGLTQVATEQHAGAKMIEKPASCPAPASTVDLDRQWKAIKAGQATIAHEKVVQWLQTWGTSTFRPWSNP
jgi:hypothetical protein